MDWHFQPLLNNLSSLSNDVLTQALNRILKIIMKWDGFKINLELRMLFKSTQKWIEFQMGIIEIL